MKRWIKRLLAKFLSAKRPHLCGVQIDMPVSGDASKVSIEEKWTLREYAIDPPLKVSLGVTYWIFAEEDGTASVHKLEETGEITHIRDLQP